MKGLCQKIFDKTAIYLT